MFILGFDTVRSLVLAARAESLCRRTASGLKDMLLWEHALSAAFVSRLIAEHCAYWAKEEAFIAGPVHDVGMAVMDCNLPRLASRSAEDVAAK